VVDLASPRTGTDRKERTLTIPGWESSLLQMTWGASFKDGLRIASDGAELLDRRPVLASQID
jgi:hypothetical protein